MSCREILELFCEQNSDKYYIYHDYSGRFMYGAKCDGIVVKKNYSYMKMLIELTRFLDEQGFEDPDLEFENPAVDELGLDTIVYFPRLNAES